MSLVDIHCTYKNISCCSFKHWCKPQVKWSIECNALAVNVLLSLCEDCNYLKTSKDCIKGRDPLEWYKGIRFKIWELKHPHYNVEQSLFFNACKIYSAIIGTLPK